MLGTREQNTQAGRQPGLCDGRCRRDHSAQNGNAATAFCCNVFMVGGLRSVVDACQPLLWR